MNDEQYWFYCWECEENDCQYCEWGFYWEYDPMMEPECPCCGSLEVHE